MAQRLHPTDDKYLNQMRELVLRETSSLDCTILLFGSRARGVHRIYEVDGVDVVTPKSVAKEFAEADYCSYEDYELFILAINNRNQLSHIYRQEMAESIRMRLPEYVSLV